MQLWVLIDFCPCCIIKFSKKIICEFTCFLSKFITFLLSVGNKDTILMLLICLAACWFNKGKAFHSFIFDVFYSSVSSINDIFGNSFFITVLLSLDHLGFCFVNHMSFFCFAFKFGCTISYIFNPSHKGWFTIFQCFI